MRVMITTPALNAMEGHGLTDAALIVDDRRVAVAYSVFSPATSRYSLVTLDGRWIIPGKEGYKTRGPASTFARKNIADVRPDGMVILEPVRHNGRYAMTRYGQRRSGICRGTVSMDRYGYKCTCGETLSFSDIHRPGWTIVTDGRRGTHTQAYAVRSSDAVEWSADVPMSCDAPVVVGGPEVPAPVEAPAPAPVEAPAEVPAPAPVEATTADGTALPFGTYRPNVPGVRTLRDARPLVIGGRTITAVVESSGWTLFAGGEILATGDAREISGDACEWFAARAMAETAETARPGVVWEREGNGAYGAKRHVVTVDGRWSFRVDVTGPDRNGLETFSAPLLLVAGRDKGVKVPTIQVADFQTYERGACEADIQAWLNREVRARETRHAELCAVGKTPRPAEYRGVCGQCRIKAPGKTRCDCTGGKTWAAGERDRADMARVFKATRKASDARAAGKDAPAGFFGWSVPARTAEWTPEGYAPGVMLAWDVEGVAFTGQVWANDVITGEWSGSSYAGSADACVIIATVDGVRATRDQAVAVPMWFGSKHGTPYARVSVPNGTDEDGKARRFTADVTVIAAECASEGLFPVEAVEESAPEENGPENDAETSAPVDPGYSLDVAEGERVFSRPGFADGGSYKGRAAVLRGVVTVGDARAAVERFPETLRTSGGAVVDGAIVPMGCAMLRARATVRTDAGYAVTLPDGTTVTGTWVECGNAFAEWAITQRPEFVCATAEGHADGAATLARIGAEVRAEREQAEAEAAQAAADLATVAADLERVWSVWSPYLADLTDEDEERVYGVDAGARTALRYARAAVERNDSGAVVHFVNEAREGVEWLAESARRSGLTVPDAPAEVPAPVAAPVRALPDVDSAPDAVEAWEGEGGAVPGVATPPVYAAETAPEPATSTGLDADTSNENRSPGGEGGFSGELDANASKNRGESAAAVAVMPIDWAKPAGRGDCAAANTCGGFGVLLWDVPGCAPRCAECAARVMGHSPAALRALTLPGDVAEAEEGAEAADIVIRHTHEDGTTVEGSSKGDGVWEALRPLGWTYRRTPGIFIRGSRYKGADRWKINRAADAVRALGLSCAVVIEETMSFAEREAARVDASEERAERYADRAGRAAASSQAARDASDRIAERFWMGQPILPDHYSAPKAYRDQERMHNAMRKSIAEGERAGYWASRAAAADAYERYRKNPGRTLRRIEKLEAERRGVLRERDGVDDKGRKADVWRREPSEARREELTRRLAEYDEELTYWAETIKEAERRGFKVWGRADFVKGDFARWRGSWYEVSRVNAKTVTVPHIHAAFDGGTVGAVGGCRVVTRAATAETRHKGSTYTLPYNEVSGRMSAEQMRAALAGEAIPADPRDVTPEPAPEEAEAHAAACALADVVSDPSGVDVWEGEGGALGDVPEADAVAVEVAPVAGGGTPAVPTGKARRALSQGLDANTSTMAIAVGEGGFSAELDVCKSNMAAVATDTVSDPGTVNSWESEGGSCPGVQVWSAGEPAELPSPASCDDARTDGLECPSGLYVVPLLSTRYRDWWGVECGRCEPGIRKALDDRWADKADAYDAARAHYELSHRAADDVLTAAELDEVAAWSWSFSAAQVQLLGWIEEAKVDEFQDGVWACDVAYDRFDVNKRVSKPRILGLLRAGLAKVLMDAPGELRAFRLTDEGRRVLRLWRRAHRHGLVTETDKDVKYEPKSGRGRLDYPWLSDGRLFPAEERALAEQNQDQGAADLPAYAPDVVSDPSGPEAMDAESGSPVEVAADRRAVDRAAVRAIMDEGEAAEVVPALGWSARMVTVMEAAAAGLLWAGEDDNTFRHCGRRVKAERVRLLMGGGFLYRSADGRVYPTDDGKRALHLVRLNPGGVYADDRAAYEARLTIAKRDRDLSSDGRKERARTLAPLPGGQEAKRRREAFYARLAEWEQRRAEARAECERIIARGEAEEAARKAEARRREAEREAAERARMETEAEARTAAVEAAERRRVKRAGRSEVRRIIAGIWHVTYQGDTYVISDECGGLWLIAPDNSRVGTVAPDGDGDPDAAQVWALLTGGQDQAAADETVERCPACECREGEVCGGRCDGCGRTAGPASHCAPGPALPQGEDENTFKVSPPVGATGSSAGLDACRSKLRGVPAFVADVVSDPGAVNGWEDDGGTCPEVENPCPAGEPAVLEPAIRDDVCANPVSCLPGLHVALLPSPAMLALPAAPRRLALEPAPIAVPRSAPITIESRGQEHDERAASARADAEAKPAAGKAPTVREYGRWLMTSPAERLGVVAQRQSAAGVLVRLYGAALLLALVLVVLGVLVAGAATSVMLVKAVRLSVRVLRRGLERGADNGEKPDGGGYVLVA
ncbi:DUF3560 domain-containing protein [Streptomyces sp. NPDC001450]